MEKAEVLNDFFVSVFIGKNSSHITQDQEGKDGYLENKYTCCRNLHFFSSFETV